MQISELTQAIDKLTEQNFKRSYILALVANHLELSLSPSVIAETKSFVREISGETPLTIPTSDELLTVGM